MEEIKQETQVDDIKQEHKEEKKITIDVLSLQEKVESMGIQIDQLNKEILNFQMKKEEKQEKKEFKL